MVVHWLMELRAAYLWMGLYTVGNLHYKIDWVSL